MFNRKQLKPATRRPKEIVQGKDALKNYIDWKSAEEHFPGIKTALLEKGYYVTPKPVISPEHLASIKTDFKKTIANTRKELDCKDEKLDLGPHGILKHHGAAYATFVRHAREHVTKNVFAKIYKSKQLWVGKDGYTYSPPVEHMHRARRYHKLFVTPDGTDFVPKTPEEYELVNRDRWTHFDQTAMKKGLWCVQGILAVETMCKDDLTFACVPGSRKYRKELFAKFPELAKVKNDWVKMNTEQLQFLESLTGTTLTAVDIPEGHVALFTSDTAHQNRWPTRMHYGTPVRNKQGKLVWKQTSQDRELSVYVREEPKPRYGIYVSAMPSEMVPVSVRRSVGLRNFRHLVEFYSTSHWATWSNKNNFGSGANVVGIGEATKDSKGRVVHLPLPHYYGIYTLEEAKLYGYRADYHHAFPKDRFCHLIRKGDKQYVYVIYDVDLKFLYKFAPKDAVDMWLAKRETEIKLAFGAHFAVPPVRDSRAPKPKPKLNDISASKRKRSPISLVRDPEKKITI